VALFAFVNKDNIVLNICVFETDDVTIAQQHCIGPYEDCTPIFCDDKTVVLNDIWDGVSFKPIQPHPNFVYFEPNHTWYSPELLPSEEDLDSGLKKN
jgi:hypothetical protein